MKYRDTYRIVTQVSRYVSHRDFRYRATPTNDVILNCWKALIIVSCACLAYSAHLYQPVITSKLGPIKLVCSRQHVHCDGVPRGQVCCTKLVDTG